MYWLYSTHFQTAQVPDALLRVLLQPPSAAGQVQYILLHWPAGGYVFRVLYGSLLRIFSNPEDWLRIRFVCPLHLVSVRSGDPLILSVLLFPD